MKSEYFTITHQTQRFAFGRGDSFYGIWQIQANGMLLVDSCPKTAAGWYRAWARFNELESHPELSDSLATKPLASLSFPALPVGLLAAGIALGTGGLFPSYLSGASLVGQSDQLVEHVLFLAAWTIATVLMVLRRNTGPAAAVFSVGLSATVLGFYLSDLGTVISLGTHIAGGGLILTIFGWFLCAEGSVLAAIRARHSGLLGRPNRPHLGLVGVAAALSIGVVVTFAPAWDSFRLYAAATGQTNSVTAGNAFANPAAIIAANVFVMVVVVTLAVLGASWVPQFLGALLLAGALVPMITQFISAIVQNATPPGPGTFGITASQAAGAQLHISSSFTPVFYLYCAFVAGLVCFCAVQLWRTHNQSHLARGFVHLPPLAVQ